MVDVIACDSLGHVPNDAGTIDIGSESGSGYWYLYWDSIGHITDDTAIISFVHDVNDRLVLSLVIITLSHNAYRDDLPRLPINLTQCEPLNVHF